jgi:4-amino-4-deoxy-L-arabinose transferase-like glycosyltransferase
MQGSFSYRSALLILLLGVFTYLYGLDSRFAPKNGDEYPYMHIVRMTANAGDWLPLQSEMAGLKNTKPPLIFWQGIVSTNWANQWTLFNLRWPSLFYTALTALFLFLSVRRFSGSAKTGLLAGLVWLSFFATYRYGRPFLTDPPEVFWMSLPFMALLYWGKAAFNSQLMFPVFAGLCLGFALLAKSFAYIVPASFALGLYYWRWREWSVSTTLIKDVYKLFFIAAIALGIFALWFALDPNPQAVWKEFVLGENVAKFDARSTNYFLDLVSGGDSIWMLILTSLVNAGLFTFVLLSTLSQCWRNRRFLSLEESLLLLLVLAFFVVFSLPSQRSGRYLLPVMPALAALLALHWDRLPLWGFRIALVLQAILFSVLIWAGSQLQLSAFTGDTSEWVYSDGHWIFMAVSLGLVILGLFKKDRSKTIALAGCFLTYCALTSSLSPLEGQLGRFIPQAVAQVQDKDLWVPCDYRAKDEEYRLLLPGARLHGYMAGEAGEVAQLTASYPLVLVQSPLGLKPVMCEGCQIIAHRIEMRARHSDEEIIEMLKGHLGKYLFVNEYLVATPVANTASLLDKKDACR